MYDFAEIMRGILKVKHDWIKCVQLVRMNFVTDASSQVWDYSCDRPDLLIYVDPVMNI